MITAKQDHNLHTFSGHALSKEHAYLSMSLVVEITRSLLLNAFMKYVEIMLMPG